MAQNSKQNFMQDQYLSCQREAYYEKDSLEASYELNESLSWKDQYFSKTLEVNLGNRIPQDIFDQFMQGDKGTSDLHSSHRKNKGCEEVEQRNDLGKEEILEASSEYSKGTNPSEWEVHMFEEHSVTNPSSDEDIKKFGDEESKGDGRLKPSIEEPPDLELKTLPEQLEYAFLEEGSKLPVIIASNLSQEKKSKLLEVLKRHKKAIAWKIADIKGISPAFCTHKILMEDNHKPTALP